MALATLVVEGALGKDGADRSITEAFHWWVSGDSGYLECTLPSSPLSGSSLTVPRVPFGTATLWLEIGCSLKVWYGMVWYSTRLLVQ